jgi:glucose-1-phosphate adenylyltransferase
LRHILNYDPEHILILSGDHLYRMDYRELYRCHTRVDADVTVCVHPVGSEEASQLGILKMHKSGRITEFYEKPSDRALLEALQVDVPSWEQFGISWERPLMASMGIYLFKTEVLIEILEKIPEMDFGRDIIPSAISEYDVQGYVFHGYWEDIGTIRSFYDANLKLASADPDFSLYEAGAPIYSHPRFLPASRVQDCRLHQSLISEGCELRGSEISESVIGIRSIIREGSKLNRALMLGADYYEDDPQGPLPLGIGRDSIIENAIIDKNARVGANVRILNQEKVIDFDGPDYFIRDGIVIIPKNGSLADGSTI